MIVDRFAKNKMVDADDPGNFLGEDGYEAEFIEAADAETGSGKHEENS